MRKLQPLYMLPNLCPNCEASLEMHAPAEWEDQDQDLWRCPECGEIFDNDELIHDDDEGLPDRHQEDEVGE